METFSDPIDVRDTKNTDPSSPMQINEVGFFPCARSDPIYFQAQLCEKTKCLEFNTNLEVKTSLKNKKYRTLALSKWILLNGRLFQPTAKSFCWGFSHICSSWNFRTWCLGQFLQQKIAGNPEKKPRNNKYQGTMHWNNNTSRYRGPQTTQKLGNGFNPGNIYIYIYIYIFIFIYIYIYYIYLYIYMFNADLPTNSEIYIKLCLFQALPGMQLQDCTKLMAGEYP